MTALFLDWLLDEEIADSRIPYLNERFLAVDQENKVTDFTNSQPCNYLITNSLLSVHHVQCFIPCRLLENSYAHIVYLLYRT